MKRRFQGLNEMDCTGALPLAGLPGRGQNLPRSGQTKTACRGYFRRAVCQESGGQGAGGVPADCCQAQHRRGLLHGLPGCLCHFRCGLCHGADRSPESTGCDSQLTFSINPLFCGPSSGTSGGRSFLWGDRLPTTRCRKLIRPEKAGKRQSTNKGSNPQTNYARASCG